MLRAPDVAILYENGAGHLALNALAGFLPDLTAPGAIPRCPERLFCIKIKGCPLRALDLFCCAGGAGTGLNRAGFEVVGVDIAPQPRYPFEFHQADALAYSLEGFDLLWASPPCQQFCALRTREDLSGYPDLIEPIRARLLASGKPFVIENVPQAPIRKDLMLCGAMFGLRSYRHRHFECNFPIAQPEHPKHLVRVNARGENRRQHWANGGFITVTGDVGVYCGPEAMGINWMRGAEMSEAIPPAYAEYIGKAALEHIAQSGANKKAIQTGGQEKCSAFTGEHELYLTDEQC